MKMNSRLLIGLTRTHCSAVSRPNSLLYLAGPEKGKFLSRTRTSDSVMTSFRRFMPPIRWNLALLLGFGVMGGVSITAIKYFKSDRTSRCQSKMVSVLEDTRPVVSEMTVKEFGVLQRVRLAMRFLYLCVLFSPALIAFALSQLLGSDTLANVSFRYILFALQQAGPAFVKLGQWASTRRDIFSLEFCQTVSDLHIHCIPHSWEDTERMLEGSFGQGWEKTLEITNQTPIGSGCVAQVYEGILQRPPGDLTGTGGGVVSSLPVAVKVLHPNIVQQMQRDIFLMKYMASWVDALYPDVHWVALTECVDEFTIILEKQVNLEKEARNLTRFQSQMSGYHNITFPTPLYPYVTSEVLVESFEHGDQISEYLDKPGGELQKNLAKVGVEVLLDMLFVHNFVHGDLHPGNILVQDSNVRQPRLVLLDCGIATSLSPLDLDNMLDVFTAIVTGQGWKVADLFLNRKQTCATLDEYRRKMGRLVDSAVKDLSLQKVRVDVLFSDLFNILIEHKVRIDPSFTSVMMAIMVIEGLGRSLDPNLDILSHAHSCVLHRVKQSARERVSNRLREIQMA